MFTEKWKRDIYWNRERSFKDFSSCVSNCENRWTCESALFAKNLKRSSLTGSLIPQTAIIYDLIFKVNFLISDGDFFEFFIRMINPCLRIYFFYFYDLYFSFFFFNTPIIFPMLVKVTKKLEFVMWFSIEIYLCLYFFRNKNKYIFHFHFITYR